MPDTPLNRVFGIATHVNAASYFDRGGLDAQLRYYLRTERHIAIHGDSKQGKTWLRANVLNAEQALVVQCGIESTAESIFREALGQLDIPAVIKRVGTSQFEGHLDLKGAGEIGHTLFAKAKGEVAAGGSGSKTSEEETEPIGQTPADLSWVARIVRASGKRLVVEDFHYVSEYNRRSLAFALKALGEYGVCVIVVGIWPEDHLLTYYNGDLDGRVEDIRLMWADADLQAVLDKGCQALNVSFTDELKAAIVRDAYGNVGLIQRLAEHVCLAAHVYDRQHEPKCVEADGPLQEARAHVARDMKARYDAFADNFVRGMKRITEGLEVYKHMLRVVTEADGAELLEGVDSRELLARIRTAEPETTMRQSDLTQALDRVDRLQTTIDIRPPVLTYNRDRRRLFLADRSFLFYRSYGTPTWPWEKDETFAAALNSAPMGEQLDLSALDDSYTSGAEVSRQPQ